MDPLSAVESTLGLNFEQRNHEYIEFYDKLVQPLTDRGVTVALVDNVGHAQDARSRPKGASAKGDRADLSFSCKLISDPAGLLVKAQKVRSVRAGHKHGDEWLFSREARSIGRHVTEESPTGSFRPTGLMQKASRLIEHEPGISTTNLRRAVGGNNEARELALKLLVDECYVEQRRDGQTVGHHSIRPYREGDE